MANLSGDISLRVLCDDESVSSVTTYAWTGGGLVLTISTTLPDSDLAFELISVYAAAPHTDTVATHIAVGRDRSESITTQRYEGASLELHPVHAPRGCAYDHAQQLIDALTPDHARVEIAEDSFRALERVQ